MKVSFPVGSYRSYLVAIVVMALFSFCCLTPAIAADRPNILFIMADDHNQSATSCYGSKTMQTPNIDRLAKEGMRFNNAVVTNALCGPSRAVLLTGKYNHLNGFYKNRSPFNGAQQTFPKLLQKAGYETAIIGKWHLRTQPTGFDYYDVMPCQGQYHDCRLKETGTPWKDGKKGGKVHEGYLTDVITDETIDWLKQRKADKPFMLMVHHKAPHGPHDPAPRFKDLFKDTKIPEPSTLLDDYAGRAPSLVLKQLRNSRLLPCKYKEYHEQVAKAKEMGREEGTRYMYQVYMKGYLRLVAAMDENIGRLLDHLDAAGLSDNTIVIYTSDNGFFNGEHGFFNKMWMYEPSLHVPLLVRWPDKIKAGTVNKDALVSMIDVAPMLLDVAGAPIPADLQGRSFKPLLTGPTPDDWRRSVYYHYYAAYGIPENYGVRTDRHKLIYYPKLDLWELFDLKTDPEETQNLFGKDGYADITTKLQAELKRLRKEYKEPEQVRHLSS